MHRSEEAAESGLIAANPADRATAPRPARSTATAPEVAEVQKLIAEAEADGDYVLATAIASAPLRGHAGASCAHSGGATGLGPACADGVSFLDRSRSQSSRGANEDPPAT